MLIYLKTCVREDIQVQAKVINDPELLTHKHSWRMWTTHPRYRTHLLEKRTVLLAEVFVQSLDWSCGCVLQRVEGIDELAQGHYHLEHTPQQRRRRKRRVRNKLPTCDALHNLTFEPCTETQKVVFKSWWWLEVSVRTGQDCCQGSSGCSTATREWRVGHIRQKYELCKLSSLTINVNTLQLNSALTKHTLWLNTHSSCSFESPVPPPPPAESTWCQASPGLLMLALA